MIISITCTAIQFVKIIPSRSKSANHIQTPVNPHDSTENHEFSGQISLQRQGH